MANSRRSNGWPTTKPFDLRRVMRELNKGIATDGEKKGVLHRGCWNNAHACIYKARNATKRTV